MVLFRYLLSFLKPIYRGVYKVFFVIAILGIIVAVFLTLFDDKRVTITSASSVKEEKQFMYSYSNYLQKSNKNLEATIFRSILCGSIGETCTNNPADGEKNYQASIFGMTTNLMVFPYMNPPASGTLYTLDKLHNIGILPNAYAAEGIGFSSLKIFQPIWQTMRDLVFLFLVFIIVIIGFMIMFRVKLDPHTIISVENALPKVILTMVLITFSYAIAGFLIDMMYVSIILVVNILSKPGNYDPSSMAWSFLSKSLFDVEAKGGQISLLMQQFSYYFKGIFALYDILPGALRSLIYLISVIFSFILTARVTGWLNPIADSIDGDIEVAPLGVGFKANILKMIAHGLTLFIGIILGPILLLLIIMLIVMLGLFLILLRIFFILLASYIQVIVYVMFAPALLLIEAIPGQKGFIPWLKTIIANLAVFPATVALFLLVQVIDQNIKNQVFSLNLGVPFISGDPSTLGNQTFTGVSGGEQTQMFLPPLIEVTPVAFLALINAAFFIMAPDFLKLIKQKIIGKEGGLNIGPGALFAGSIGGVASGGMSTLGQVHTIGLGLHAVTGKSIADMLPFGKGHDAGGGNGPNPPHKK